MRKYLASLVFIGGMLVAPPLMGAPSVNEADTTPAVAVQRVRMPPAGGLRDEAAMVLVGTALIGLAAAVRRAC